MKTKKPHYQSMQDIFAGLNDEPTKKVLKGLLTNGILSASTVKDMISRNEIVILSS